jgi:hypothetical protein
MHVRRQTILGCLICVVLAVVAGCAPVRGYPDDPENTDATLATLTSQYFSDGTREQAYFKTSAADTVARTQLRDEIILGRMRAYDIEFADFEKKLYGDGNGLTLGSDLVGLILAGLTATTGNAATKSALGAASAGVIGAKAAVDKDLYYQKTIPAMLAQMEADRLKALATITAGMKLPDTGYSLMQAYIDLDAYKTAGSIPAAINVFNKDAGQAKDVAQAIVMGERASAQAQLISIVTVQSQLKTLTTDAQILALMKQMQPNLAGRSQQIQNLVKSIDSKNVRLTNAAKARQVINAWLGEDDLTAANQKQWLDAITAAAAAKGS